MTNVYRSRRSRDPLVGLYVPAILLVGLAVFRQFGDAPAPEPVTAHAKSAPYIRLQSRSDRESGTASSETSRSPFRNCTEARAAGYEDIPASSPLYGEHMDGDHDGLACEPVRPHRR